MSTTNNNSKPSQLDKDSKLLAGLTKNQANLPSFVLGGKTYTPAECVSVLQTRVTAGSEAVTARAASKKATEDHRNEIGATKQVVSELRTALLLAYGNAPEVLADYGMAPRKKPTPQSVDTKAVAAAKRKATRAARKTMGPKQRAAVKGSIPTTLHIAVPQPEPVVIGDGSSGSANTGDPAPSPSNNPSPAPSATPKGSQ